MRKHCDSAGLCDELGPSRGLLRWWLRCCRGLSQIPIFNFRFVYMCRLIPEQRMPLCLKEDTEQVQRVSVGTPSSLRCSWNPNNAFQDVFPAIQPLLIISIAPNSTSFCCSNSSLIFFSPLVTLLDSAQYFWISSLQVSKNRVNLRGQVTFEGEGNLPA